jgi:hypothetical protein
MEAMNDGHAFERELLSRHPIGRFGNVAECAEAAVFLSEDGAHFVTGANMSIDGAYSRVRRLRGVPAPGGFREARERVAVELDAQAGTARERERAIGREHQLVARQLAA